MRRLMVPCAVVLDAAGCSKLTAENYATVKPGMTYGEVIALLGRPDSRGKMMGFKSCRRGYDSRSATVRFAGEGVVRHSASNIR